MYIELRDHINSTTNKGNSALGFICRNITTNSTEIKSTVYKQIVRPVLEYASCSTDSLVKTLEDEIEAVQRRAARVIYNIKRSDYKTSTTNLLSGLQLLTNSQRGIATHASNYLASITPMWKADTIRN